MVNQMIGYKSSIIMSMQICEGEVTTLHLYQGAFVDIGGVHEGYISFCFYSVNIVKLTVIVIMKGI